MNFSIYLYQKNTVFKCSYHECTILWSYYTNCVLKARVCLKVFKTKELNDVTIDLIILNLKNLLNYSCIYD